MQRPHARTATRSTRHLLGLALAAGLLAPVRSPASLIFHYAFEGNTNNQGSGTATLNNLPGAGDYVPGAPGFGLAFNSANAHPWASPGITGGLDFSAITISMMIRGTNLPSWDDFWSVYDGANHAVLETNGSDGLSVFNIDGPPYHTTGNLTTPTNIEDGEWHWVAMTGDQAANESRLYIDGALVSSKEWNWSGTVSQFQITSRLFDGSRVLTADVDEFRMYNEVLTQPEIAALMVAVPEPASMILFAGTGGLLLLVRRRRA